MAYLRQNIKDPYVNFRPVYGIAEENSGKIPSYDKIVGFRAAFHRDRIRTVTRGHKKASKVRGTLIEHFKSNWGLESNSMLYTITEKRGNQCVASPCAVEVGLYDGWSHLQRLSLNCASIDIENCHKLDEDGSPFSFAHQLYFGDLIVVLDLGFYQPPSIQTHAPEATVLKYYVLTRNIEKSIILAVRKDRDTFCLYNGSKNRGYPAAPITEQTLRRKMGIMPTAQQQPRSPLADVFLIDGLIFAPSRKCFHLGLNFNRNCTHQELVSKLLLETSQLTSRFPDNFKPYLPHIQLLSGKFSGYLENLLESSLNTNIMLGLKLLRAAKIQSSASCLTDRRIIHAITCGASTTPTGELYVKFRTNSPINHKSFQIETILEIDGVWREPLIGTVTNFEMDKTFKYISVRFTTSCGFVNTNDVMVPNVVNFEQYWIEIKRLFYTSRNVTMRCFEKGKPYDVLASSESTYNPTMLGNTLVEGLQACAVKINSKDVIHVEANHGALYLRTHLPDTSLSDSAIKVFTDCLRHTPSEEQLHIFEKVLDQDLPFHAVESVFGSGKSATAVAAGTARVTLQSESRVAFLAQTNSAVEALLKSSHLSETFDANYVSDPIRPLVIQSKNWRFAKGTLHPFDHTIVMSHVFLEELMKADPRTCPGSERVFRTMFQFVRSSKHVDISQLPNWKYKILAQMKMEMLLDEELFRHFMSIYRPNLYYATLDMFAAFCESTYLPLCFYPDLIMNDESTMLAPFDLSIFASKMERWQLRKPIRYMLFGDMQQLEPYNTIRTLAPLNVSPNKLLLQMNYVPSKLTCVYRTHPAATEVLSKLFYNGCLTSGRPSLEKFLQSSVPDSLFPQNGHQGFHFRANTHQSHRVSHSRVNLKEAHDVVEYARALIRSSIQPSSIVVVTPYSAQKDLIKKSIPNGVRVRTTRKYQGGECDVVLFSSCATTVQKKRKEANDDEEDDDESRVRLKNGQTNRVYLISDPSIVLVSLSRARHFTTIFGNKSFLSTIPVWSRFFELCGF